MRTKFKAVVLKEQSGEESHYVTETDQDTVGIYERSQNAKGETVPKLVADFADELDERGHLIQSAEDKANEVYFKKYATDYEKDLQQKKSPKKVQKPKTDES